jgi:hypothetical protein
MKKGSFFLILIWFFVHTALAQVTDGEKHLRDTSKFSLPDDSVKSWKKGGVVDLSLSQASFNNWSAGGENSLAVKGLMSIYANYKRGKSSWDNMLDIGYGLLNEGDKQVKTDDKIDLSSKYGRMLSKHWYYAAFFNFKTQFAPGYDYPNDSVAISKSFAPAYVVLAMGIDYKPVSNFTGYVAPVTGKLTIVNDKALSDSGAYGVNKGEVFKTEFGGYVRLVYNQDLMKKSVSVLSKLDLFSNYLCNPQNIDVSWENIINFKVNKFISANISTQIAYDDDVKITDSEGKTSGPKLQFKEILGIGFNYKF